MTLFSFLRDQSAWKVWPSIAQLYSARLIAFNRGSIETVTALPLYPNWMEIESDSFGECTSPADYLCQKGVDGIEFRRLINRQHNRFDFYSITAGRPAVLGLLLAIFGEIWIEFQCLLLRIEWPGVNELRFLSGFSLWHLELWKHCGGALGPSLRFNSFSCLSSN